MYKVERAIILAAGFGSRLLPLTEVTPKPLINVNGKVIIERMIEALKENGIEEINIVVGYKKEKFEYLKDKYSNIRFIENKYYDTSNNISSIYAARDVLKNVIILEADILIYNSAVLNSKFEKSGYNCVYMDNGTAKEWGLKVENNTIINCDKTGGKNNWQLYGISRWDEENGNKLKEHVKIEFESNKESQLYWDDIALIKYPNEYNLGIYEMQKNDVIEIDTLEELKSIDKKYI